MHNTKFNYKRW